MECYNLLMLDIAIILFGYYYFKGKLFQGEFETYSLHLVACFMGHIFCMLSFSP